MSLKGLHFSKKPEGHDVSVCDDGTGMFVALTASSYHDLQSKLTIALEGCQHAIDDAKLIQAGYVESEKEVQRLTQEVKHRASVQNSWMDIADKRVQIIKNLEAQRDVLIRAIGDLGDKV